MYWCGGLLVGLLPPEGSQTMEKIARMAELADALDSGSSGRKVVQVQVLLRALVLGSFLFAADLCYVFVT